MVPHAAATKTRDANAVAIIQSIRSGKWREPVEKIREIFSRVLRETDDLRKAKAAVDSLKKKLPGFIATGQFSGRQKPAATKLVKHSGLFCADLDNLGERLAEVRQKLTPCPHLFALFTSPTGHGLKALFRVEPDPTKHAATVLAVRTLVLEMCGVEIDSSCKDLARLCFVSDDLGAILDQNATELPLPPEREAPQPGGEQNGSPNTPGYATRRTLAESLFGPIRWENEIRGYLTCPGQNLHTTASAERDCMIYLEGPPTITCFHTHCEGILKALNRELRSRIGKAESGANGQASQKASGKKSEGEASRAPKQPDKSGRKSAATRLIELASRFEFFHDPQKLPFARLGLNGHVEVWPVNSTQFRSLIAQIFYRVTRTVINRNALSDAIATLAGRACYDCPEEPVFLRIAPHDATILIDLCDPQWRAIQVTPTGWSILQKSPVPFIRTGAMRPLPLPAPAAQGSLDPLWELLNVTSAQRPLVAGALLNHFHPNGPYFVILFVGEQGSAKSCATRIFRMLIDPNKNPLRSPPKDERDLMIQGANNWCVALDNLSSLPGWLSDALCRLATGGGLSARQLYTDGEEFSLEVKRPAILNGIDDVATRPDLAERSLQIALEGIPGECRMTERELMRRFEAAWPVIFSGILNGLVCALRELPNVRMSALPRMADAAIWATAGETAFGWPPGTFLAAYSRNLNDGAIASIEAHSVGVAIRRFLDGRIEWSGEPARLFEILSKAANEEEKRATNWPKNARSLSSCLRRLAPAFRRSGIDIDFGRRKRREIRLCKQADFASPASAESPTDDANDANDARS